jgi:hypothetical protein
VRKLESGAKGESEKIGFKHIVELALIEPRMGMIGSTLLSHNTAQRSKVSRSQTVNNFHTRLQANLRTFVPAVHLF